MTRIISFAVIVLLIGFGFSWLADRPGVLSITWQGQLIEMSLMVAASMVAALIAVVMIVWWMFNTLWNSPHAARRYFRARKRDRGYQALSTGLIAAGAGNAILARKMTARTQGLLSADQEPLIHLLEAQSDLIEGKYDAARRKFEAMANDPETRELGLRGLYIEARRQGAHEAALQYAEDAAKNAPYLPWAAQATLETKCRNGEWDDAIRLLDQQKAASVIERGDPGTRWRARTRRSPRRRDGPRRRGRTPGPWPGQTRRACPIPTSRLRGRRGPRRSSCSRPHRVGRGRGGRDGCRDRR